MELRTLKALARAHRNGDEVATAQIAGIGARELASILGIEDEKRIEKAARSLEGKGPLEHASMIADYVLRRKEVEQSPKWFKIPGGYDGGIDGFVPVKLVSELRAKYGEPVLVRGLRPRLVWESREWGRNGPRYRYRVLVHPSPWRYASVVKKGPNKGLGTLRENVREEDTVVATLELETLAVAS